MSYIKGSCEHCGFAFKGEVKEMGELVCPNCKKVTQNFDEAYVIDGLEKAEGYKLDYQEVSFN